MMKMYCALSGAIRNSIEGNTYAGHCRKNPDALLGPRILETPAPERPESPSRFAPRYNELREDRLVGPDHRRGNSTNDPGRNGLGDEMTTFFQRAASFLNAGRTRKEPWLDMPVRLLVTDGDSPRCTRLSFLRAGADLSTQGHQSKLRGGNGCKQLATKE